MSKSPHILIAGLFTTGGLVFFNSSAIASLPKRHQEVVNSALKEYSVEKPNIPLGQD